MSDMSTAGQNIFTQQRQTWITQMMQACAMHNLSINLPVAYMAELRFQQVTVSSIHEESVLITSMHWYCMVICKHTKAHHFLRRP